MACAPGLHPISDDQGPSKFCTRFGLCKAYTEVCDQLGVDVKQGEIAKLLVNLYTDKDAKFATDFNGVKLQIQDCKTKKWYSTTLSVKESSLRGFISNSKEKAGAFVLNWAHQNGPHCVYAKQWIESQKEIMCLNSWGEVETEPHISPGDVTEIYRVSLVLVDQDTGAILETKTPSQPTKTHPHTLTVASTGPAKDTQWRKMGVYTRTNVWPHWANHDKSQIIYCDEDGRLKIGPSTTRAGIRTEQAGLSEVPRKGWMYHHRDNNWVGDSQLEVTAGAPSYPGRVTIKSTGAAEQTGLGVVPRKGWMYHAGADKLVGDSQLELTAGSPSYPQLVTIRGAKPAWVRGPTFGSYFRSSGPAGDRFPECMGVYIKQAGEKVWKHQTEERYLFYDGNSHWVVGPDPKDAFGYLKSKQSGLVNIPNSNWEFSGEDNWTLFI